ncbi:MAG: hypothetical protein ACRDO1_06730 [Nocardioidaceae bacterium]
MFNIARALRRHDPVLPASLSLDAGERVLASATDGTGQWYVGTLRALHIADDSQSRRLPWESIERAEWDRDEEQLVVVESAEFGAPAPEHRAALVDADRLLQLVRERVTASVVVSRFVAVEGKRGITVVARRAPHTDDELTWTYVVDRGLDASSAAVATAAERGLAEARAEVGD